MYSVPPAPCSIPPCTHADDPIPDALCYPRPTTCGLCGRDTASPSCTSCTTHDKHTLIGSSLYKHKRACQKGARPSSASCSHLLQPPSRESALHGRQRQHARRRCGLPHHTFKRRLKAWAHGLEASLTGSHALPPESYMSAGRQATVYRTRRWARWEWTTTDLSPRAADVADVSPLSLLLLPSPKTAFWRSPIPQPTPLAPRARVPHRMRSG